MKISVITPTYNRAYTIHKLYKSLLMNNKYDVSFEWIVIDDGSNDNTKEVIQEFISENKINIKYYFQENQGKMAALNNVMKYSDGDLIIECDSDDYFTDNAFKMIKDKYEELQSKENEDVFALLLLKHDQNNINIGSNLEDGVKDTMFNLYYKRGVGGDKALVFKSDVRKKYKHKLENNERFVREARLYQEIGLKYKVLCFNEPIMICEYMEDGYTHNMDKFYRKYPYGCYKYFEEMFDLDLKGLMFEKRRYIIKNFIIFSYLTNNKQILKKIKGLSNKIMAFLYMPIIYINTKYLEKNEQLKP